MAWIDRRPPSRPERFPSCEVIAWSGLAKDDALGGRVDLTDRVLSIRTVKSLSSPAGTFTVTFTMEPPTGFTAPLSEVLVSGNVLDLSLDAGLPESAMETVMRGWVTGVEELVTLDQRGRPQRIVVVSGMDMGLFFLRHELPGHLLTGYIQGDKESAERLKNGLFFGGLTGEVLRAIFLACFEVLTPVPLSVREDGQLLTDPVLDGEGADALLSFLTVQSIWEAHGKFWNLWSQYADRPWNEVFGDFVPYPGASAYKDYYLAKPGASAPPLKPGIAGTLGSTGGVGYYLIARRTPFDADRWNALPTTTVFGDEVRMRRLRRADDERVNLVIVRPFGQGTRITGDEFYDGAVFQSLFWDRDSTERYGTRALQAGSLYTDIGGAHQDPAKQRAFAAGKDTGQDSELTNAVRQRAGMLWRWNAVNHQLRKGVLVIAGTPSIRIGERVQEDDATSTSYVATEGPPGVGYVEQVVQDFAVGARYHTHLAVTRWQPRGGCLLAEEEGYEAWRQSSR